MEDKIKELKAQAYDCLANIEHFQRLLQELNKQISELSAKKDE